MKTISATKLLSGLALIILFCGFFPKEAYSQRASPLIADHNAVISFNSGQIPTSYFNSARQKLRIVYGHTSHGSQIVTGMDMLANESSLYQYSDNFFQDSAFDGSYLAGASDLGNPSRTAWTTATRNYLNGAGEDRNVVIWSWCGQHDATESEINLYLNRMSQLELDFPNVTFIYMTGHLNPGGPDSNTYERNEQIRTYCRNNNKVLFDFADIESHDPNGTDHPDDDDSCNWCSSWCQSHSCPDCNDCAHSHCFNCYQKGKAFWWLMARLAGWGGTSPQTCAQSGGTCLANSCSSYKNCASASGICFSGYCCSGACTLLGDLNSDNVVDIIDLVIVGSNFGKDYNNVNTDKRADASGDRVIDIVDLVIVGSNFGK